jgi:peptide/nickel transport system substrate-binding protein
MKRALSVLLAIGLLASLALVVTAQDPLIMGTTDRVTQLAFANSYDHYSWHVLRATTDALMKLDPDTLELKGAIAESWDISADGMEYTFHIRPGITFWDGAACDAAAVKWSLDRTIRLDGPEGGVGLIKGVIDHIDVIDPLTVKITLTMPDAIFLLRMEESLAPALIYSPLTTPENDFANGVYAGTGPYKLLEHVPDQWVKYEAYDGYYGTAPKSKLVIEKTSCLGPSARRISRTFRITRMSCCSSSRRARVFGISCST